MANGRNSSIPGGAFMNVTEPGNADYTCVRSGQLELQVPNPVCEDVGIDNLLERLIAARDYVVSELGTSFRNVQVLLVDVVVHPPSSPASYAAPFRSHRELDRDTLEVQAPSDIDSLDKFEADLRWAFGVMQTLEESSRRGISSPAWLLAGMGFWFYSQALPSEVRHEIVREFELRSERAPTMAELMDSSPNATYPWSALCIGYYAVRRYYYSAVSLRRVITGDVRPKFEEMLEDILRLYCQ